LLTYKTDVHPRDISTGEYAGVIDILARMAANLQTSAA